MLNIRLEKQSESKLNSLHLLALDIFEVGNSFKNVLALDFVSLTSYTSEPVSV